MKETSYSNATAVDESGKAIASGRITVRHDPAVCAVNETTLTASMMGSPGIPQGASEIGIMIATSNGKVDEHGNLLGKNGEIITEADKGETLKESYASAQALIDDATRINYTGTVKLDGSVVHRDGPAIVGYGSNPDGTVTRLAQSPQPVAPISTVTLPAAEAEMPHYVLTWPASGQLRFRTQGIGAGASFEIQVPAGVTIKPDQLGQIGIAEVGGGAVLARDLTIAVETITVVDTSGSGNSAPTATFTVGNHGNDVPSTFNADPTETIRITVRNGPNNTAQSSDFLLDFATPERY